MEKSFLALWVNEIPLKYSAITPDMITDGTLRGLGHKLVGKVINVNWKKQIHEAKVIESGEYDALDTKAEDFSQKEYEKFMKAKQNITGKRTHKTKQLDDYVTGSQSNQRQQKDKNKDTAVPGSRNKAIKVNSKPQITFTGTGIKRKVSISKALLAQVKLQNMKRVLSPNAPKPFYHPMSNKKVQKCVEAVPELKKALTTDTSDLSPGCSEKIQGSTLNSPQSSNSADISMTALNQSSIYNSAGYGCAGYLHARLPGILPLSQHLAKQTNQTLFGTDVEQDTILGPQNDNRASSVSPTPSPPRMTTYINLQAPLISTPSSSRELAVPPRTLFPTSQLTTTISRSDDFQTHHSQTLSLQPMRHGGDQFDTAMDARLLDQVRCLQKSLEIMTADRDRLLSNRNDLVTIAPGLTLQRNLLELARNDAKLQPNKLAINLLPHFFAHEELHNGTRTGKMSNANKKNGNSNCPAALDRNKMQGIINYSLTIDPLWEKEPNPANADAVFIRSWKLNREIIRSVVSHRISDHLWSLRNPRPRKSDEIN